MTKIKAFCFVKKRRLRRRRRLFVNQIKTIFVCLRNGACGAAGAVSLKQKTIKTNKAFLLTNMFYVAMPWEKRGSFPSGRPLESPTFLLSQALFIFCCGIAEPILFLRKPPWAGCLQWLSRPPKYWLPWRVGLFHEPNLPLSIFWLLLWMAIVFIE